MPTASRQYNLESGTWKSILDSKPRLLCGPWINGRICMELFTELLRTRTTALRYAGAVAGKVDFKSHAHMVGEHMVVMTEAPKTALNTQNVDNESLYLT